MMGIMGNEYAERVERWLRTLQRDFYLSLGEISFEGFTTMAHLTPEEAAKGAFQPFPTGTVWGHTWEYLWLRGRVTLPRAARGRRIVMSLDLSGEAALFVNGQAFGTRRAEWVSVPHHYIVDNELCERGEVGAAYDLLFEVYAGHYFPNDGHCATGPALPGAYQDPLTEGERARVGRSTFGVWNEDAYQLWLDASALKMVMDELPETSLRAAKIADGLEAFTRVVDFEAPYEERTSSYFAAREALRPLLAAKNGTTAPRMSAIGNAHIDLAWLWPQQETHRKTARTFAQQLRLLDRYPEYRFLQSQPASYEMCRDHYPKLYERIVQAVKAGRWIADGAMYVEPDTNMPSGEALIRQLVIGKRFYREEFGVDSRMLWLPDTFGYSAALPQILRGCGVEYLVTQKIFWSYNDSDRFPYHYFTWKGMDGSRVTSFLPTSYTYRTDPKELCGVWRDRVQKRGLDAFLIPFGYGDGGGGPCRDDIEFALRERDLEGMPRVEMESPLCFFERLAEQGDPQNVWTGELYFSAHRGTYTSQAAIKRNNRLSEIALRELELWGALACWRAGRAYPADDALRLWKTLLLHQFHDILPGSCIARVYEEANAVLEALQREARALSDGSRAAMTARGEGVTLFNSLGFEREEIVALPEAFAGGARTAEGEPVPVRDGLALVRLPAMGGMSLLPAENAGTAACPLARASYLIDALTLENDLVRVDFSERTGEICSYRFKGGREFAAGGMNRFLLYKDVPRRYDAWDIDSNYAETPAPTLPDVKLTIERAEGLTASLKLVRTLAEGIVITQIISLDANDTRVVFDTTVAWHTLHRLLKVSFPVDVHAENALNEIQFGFVERPTHRSRASDRDRFEVCNHRYTALCDNSHGCAVLNDCKYGVSVLDNRIELTLLRASASPAMRADNGTHRFRYAFTAWEGAFADADAAEAGLRLNVPVTMAEGVLPRFSAFSTDCPNVLIDTVKLAEDGSGDLIARLYESRKADVAFTLRTSLPVADVWLCDMLETPQRKIDPANMTLHARPFEVLTVRLRGKAE